MPRPAEPVPDHPAVVVTADPDSLSGKARDVRLAWQDRQPRNGRVEPWLHAGNVYGAVVLVRLAKHQYKVGITADHIHLRPLAKPLADLSTAVLRCPRDARPDQRADRVPR